MFDVNVMFKNFRFLYAMYHWSLTFYGVINFCQILRTIQCQECLTLWPHRVLQARILEWVAIPFSRGSLWPRDWTHVSQLQADSLPSEPPGKPPRKCTFVQNRSLYSRSPWLLKPTLHIYEQKKVKKITLLHPAPSSIPGVPAAIH